LFAVMVVAACVGCRQYWPQGKWPQLARAPATRRAGSAQPVIWMRAGIRRVAGTATTNLRQALFPARLSGSVEAPTPTEGGRVRAGAA